MEYSEDVEIYTMTDEDGNDVTVQALDYFFYNGEEYAVMTELAEGQEPWTEEREYGDDDGPEVFFMKVVELDDDNVEFEPVEDEDLADELFEILNDSIQDAIDEDDGSGDE